MNTNESQSSADPSSPLKGGNAPSPMRFLFGAVIGLIAVVAGYSIYVGVHEPDPQELILLGQRKVVPGSPAPFRVVVRNSASGKAIENAAVEVKLQPKNSPKAWIPLGKFRTDANGCIAEPIRLPEKMAGEYNLEIDAVSRFGRDHVVSQIEVNSSNRVFLASDKPAYQPGQTIHLRGLVQNKATQRPFTNEPVTFEICDPKGNKVFKEIHKTSGFGIASADFTLGGEVNLGRYTARVSSASANADLDLEIKEYVVPKFTIQGTADRTYYLPGQSVSGSIKVVYAFGRPVANARVQLEATATDIAMAKIRQSGQTDAAGQFAFKFAMPDWIPGTKTKTPLSIKVEITDTAGHTQERVISALFARDELELNIVPETPSPVSGIENILYALASYPDGTPAPCKIYYEGKSFDAPLGVCEVKFVPTGFKQTVELVAVDSASRKRKASFSPEIGESGPPLLLRPDKAVYNAGETAHLSVLSTQSDRTVYIDVLKDGQTVLTRSARVQTQKADLGLKLPENVTGMLQLHAYFISDEEAVSGCSRMVFVNPATGLRITPTLSKPVYRPGEIARMDFAVTDAAGKPTVAALGLALVDRAIYALAEKRPGFPEQLTGAEMEGLTPRDAIPPFSSGVRVFTSGNSHLAQAYCSSLARSPHEQSLEQLLKNYGISKTMVDRIRIKRGTRVYNSYRQMPVYAEIIEKLEGRDGLYDVHEQTGAAKRIAVKAHRDAYFDGLGLTFATCVVCGLLLLPFALDRLSSAGKDISDSTDPQLATHLRATRQVNNVLELLTILPFFLYPLGAFLAVFSGSARSGWLLLGTETVLVLTVLVLHYAQIAKFSPEHFRNVLAPLRGYILAFAGQFVISRGGLILMCACNVASAWLVLWVLCSLVAPMVVLAFLSSYWEQQFAAKEIKVQSSRITVFEVLAAVVVIALLAAMLLPALASAKQKGQGVTFANDLRQLQLSLQMAKEDHPASGDAQVRVRRDFPETLFWNPQIITDERGRASVEITLADSITRWQASIDAIGTTGKMGGTESSITVFQDFFVDVNLPVSLSLGDCVSVPVTCHNYLKEAQDVTLTLAPADWFESTAIRTNLHLQAGEVKSVFFPIRVCRVGSHRLQIFAKGLSVADAIERVVKVLPTGKEITLTQNTVLAENLTVPFTVPPEAIPDSQGLRVKFYPSRFSEVVEGLDSMLQEPHGCFEQTSSTTYPNVLVLDYLKRMGRLTPEVESKARRYINAGYQRLLTFEVPGGGFEWFGHSPANVGLTAYGILEFTDMQQVYPVDQAMVDRTRRWLYSRQNVDGSWDGSYAYDSGVRSATITAYVTWALAESHDTSPGLDKALDYLRTHPGKVANNYQKALAANAVLARDARDRFGHELVNKLQAAAIVQGKTCHWTSTDESLTFSHNKELEVETTALCVMALIKAGNAPDLVNKALTWISQTKTRHGTWGSTQGSILAIRALILGSSTIRIQNDTSKLTVLLNGELIQTLTVTPETSDLMRQVDLTSRLRTGENRLELRQSPAGGLPIQVAGAYWLPNQEETGRTNDTPFEIGVAYDRASVVVGEAVECSVVVRNNAGIPAKMPIVALGIPPGFDVDPSAFESMQKEGRIARFEFTGTNAVIYLRELPAGASFGFAYSLRAKYPLRVQSPISEAYEYYAPQIRATAPPVIIEAK